MATNSSNGSIRDSVVDTNGTSLNGISLENDVVKPTSAQSDYDATIQSNEANPKFTTINQNPHADNTTFDPDMHMRYMYGQDVQQDAVHGFDLGQLSGDRTDTIQDYETAAKAAGLSKEQIAQNINQIENQTDSQANASDVSQMNLSVDQKWNMAKDRTSANVSAFSANATQSQWAQLANKDLQEMHDELLEDKNSFKYDETYAGESLASVMNDLKAQESADNANISQGESNANSANSAWGLNDSSNSSASGNTNTSTNASNTGSLSDVNANPIYPTSSAVTSDNTLNSSPADTTPTDNTDANSTDSSSDASSDASNSATDAGTNPSNTMNATFGDTVTGKVSSHAVTRTSKTGKQVPLYANKASVVSTKDKNGKSKLMIKLDAKTRADLDKSPLGGQYLSNSGKTGDHSQLISEADFNKILKANGKKPLTNAQFEAAMKSGKPLVNAKDNLAFNADVKSDGTNHDVFDVNSISKSPYKFDGKNEKALEAQKASQYRHTHVRHAFSSQPKAQSSAHKKAKPVVKHKAHETGLVR